MRAFVVAAVLVACDGKQPINTCDDNLHGVWTTPSNARWMILDYGATLEAFALFDDAVTDGAPRLIDLSRAERFAGEVKRRYQRGADICTARAPIRVTRCGGRELELVLADPVAPITYAPCTWPQHAPSRVERWRR